MSLMRRVKAGGGRAAPSKAKGGGRTASPKDQRGGTATKTTATSRSGAARRRAGTSGAKGSKPAAKQGPGPGGREGRGGKATSTAGGPMATREERKRDGTLGGQARGEPPEDVGGRAPREGLLETEGVSMRAEQDEGGRKEKRQARSPSKSSPVAKPRAQGGHGGKEPKDPAQRRTVEPLQPGGELGDTREVPAAGSANELSGKVPETKVVHHRPGRGPEGSRMRGLEGDRAGGRPGSRGEGGNER